MKFKIEFDFYMVLCCTNVMVYYVKLLLAGSLVTARVHHFGLSATFTCSSFDNIGITGVQWFLNGTQLDELNVMNISTYFFDDFYVAFLIFEDVTLQYNSTTVQCELRSTSGTTSLTPIRTLLVQGRETYEIRELK